MYRILVPSSILPGLKNWLTSIVIRTTSHFTIISATSAYNRELQEYRIYLGLQNINEDLRKAVGAPDVVYI